MERAVLEQRNKKELLDFVLASGARTREKLSEAERLLGAIKAKVESDPLLKSLLGSLADSLWVPDPPLPSNAEEIGRKLEDYEKQLDGVIAQLRAVLESVDRIGKLAPLARELEEKLNSWASVLKDVNPPLYSELIKSASKIRRVLGGLSGLDPVKAGEALSKVVEEGEQLEVRARAEYNKALRHLAGEVDSVREIVRKALSVTLPHERLKVEECEKELQDIAEKLNSARLSPVPLNPPQMYAELNRIRKVASETLGSALSPEEARVLDAYSRIASTAEARLFMLHELVDLVSRRAEVPHSEAFPVLYELSRKGLIRVFVKPS